MPETLTQIGRYEISRQLVDTALASVYDAFDPVERKPVAIRIPRTTQHGLVTMANQLRHPGLMTVLNYEQNQGEPFAVLEPFRGMPLAAGCKIEPAEAVGLLRQLASVLDYAHAHGSLHGSLCPSSILQNDRGEVKVLDLGASVDVRSAAPEQLLRAIHYLAPECVLDQPMDGRADQYSLAVLGHDMLTGQLPYSGKPLGAMFRIAYLGLEREAMRELPPAAQNVFVRALSKRPVERYATCGEMVDALSNALLRTAPAPTRIVAPAEFPPERPDTAARAVTERPRSSGLFSREGLKYFGLTFLACALLLGALLYFLLPKPPKPVPLLPAATQPATTPPPQTPQPAIQPAPAPPPAQEAAAPKPVESAPPPKAEPKAASKTRAKKKAPEIDVKPAEPKIIR